MTLATPAANTILTELSSGRSIRLGDRPTLGLDSLVLEALLNEVATDPAFLLHGSGGQIRNATPLRLRPGKDRHGAVLGEVAFATDVAAIAILKALFDNGGGVNLGYPWSISPQTPLRLTIRNWRAEAERPSGFVYLVGPRPHFKRDHNTWQWFTDRKDAQFFGGIEVNRGDFSYPVDRA